MPLPEGLLLLENWIDSAEEARVVEWIDSNPWDESLKRRTQHYGYRYDYSSRRSGLDLELGPLPDLLADLARRAATTMEVESFDQVIVNEYLPGQGISTHVDRPDSFGPVVVGVSLLSPAVMQFRRHGHDPVDVDLPPGSLLGLTGPSRYEWSHAIPLRANDPTAEGPRPRRRRVSITFRQILR